jgi:cytochrome c553
MNKKLTRNIARAAGMLSGASLALLTTLSLADDMAAAAPAPAAPAVSSYVAKVDAERTQLLTGKWCQACHSAYGRSVQPTFPSLAGQSAEYIVTELKYFHNLNQDDRAITHETMFEQWMINITGLRRNYRYDDAPRNEPRAWDFMKGVARDLDDTTMQLLADYYSKQTPLPGRPARYGDVQHGMKLYTEGDPDRGLIACAMCHGPDAKGQGPIPRLAGQHADYVKLQLGYIQSGLRNVEQMQALLTNLTKKDFEDVAAYVQTLN